MKDNKTLNIVGKVICTNEEENTWGILANEINGVKTKKLLIDKVTDRGGETLEELSTVVVGLEVLLNQCGIKKTFNENDNIEITIKC